MTSITADIPKSNITVKVSIIDTTVKVPIMQYNTIMGPEIAGFDPGRFSSFAFLIEHPSGRKTIYDLGIRKDWENLPPMWVSLLKQVGLTVEKDVPEILNEHGIDVSDIEAVIWSHWHFEHVGDPSKFPASTQLVVGPGTKASLIPGYPANPKSLVNDEAFQGREVRELDFEEGKKIGGFDAYDYFGDGSFYVLNAPGHAVGHLAALARTTSDPPTFILMVGDGAHHPGEIRPSPLMPLPDSISPNPLNPGSPHPCLGSAILSCHPTKAANEPFFHAHSSSVNPIAMHDEAEYAKTLRRIQDKDADNNVFVVLAHDESLRGIVEFFPNDANKWQEKGWGQKARWAFLQQFKAAL